MKPAKFAYSRAVHGNAGIAALYRKRLDALIAEMHRSVLSELRTAYAPPAHLAQDAKPSLKGLRKRMQQLWDRWIARFDEHAPKIAEAYVRSTFKATDSAMRQALKDAGWTVKFEMTPAMREMYDATLTENVALIKSIPAEYLQQVEGIAMRSFTAGHDRGAMTQALKALYPKASHRAALISRDQTNKANGVVIRTRRLELGITEAIWMHSHAGKVPRPTHVAMNGKPFKVAEGMWDSAEQRMIQPGELINCRCTSRSVLPFSVG